MYALVGSGEYLPPMEVVDRELLNRLGRSARVVCLPTGAGTEGAKRISYWSQAGVDHFTKLGVQVETVPVIDRASANNPEYAGRVAQANFIYLSGGKPDYLYNTLAGSAVWDAIEAVISDRGLLAGCSAGAMIQGERFGFTGTSPGFSLWPGVMIIPHFDEIPQFMVKPLQWLSHGLTMVGVEKDTAFFHDGRNYEVIGSGGVTIWSKHHKERYTAGPIPTDVMPGVL